MFKLVANSGINGQEQTIKKLKLGQVVLMKQQNHYIES